MTEQIDPTDARQGRKGTRVFTVLTVSLALMVVAWFIFELIWK